MHQYGVKFVTEDDLHLFGDVSGKKLLEICCGSGHSLKYHADRGAGELWGVDLSQKQPDNAERFLSENGYSAKLICSPMETDIDIPKGYFDYVYSIYGIGWTTDLNGAFCRIASYLKKDGAFIFSWHHTLHYCAAWSCEERREVIEDGSEIVLCNRKISTYVNALADAGFVIEKMVEQNVPDGDDLKAEMVPISVCFKAGKL